MRTDEQFNAFNDDVKNALKKSFINVPSFHVVLSNPPYQIENPNGAVACYQNFVNVSEMISKYVSMIHPARWLNGGRGEGLDEFRKKALSSSKYVKFYVYSGEKEVFESAIIKGGICYFLWDTNKTIPELTYSYDNKVNTRNTLLNGMTNMIQNNDFISIIRKVNTKSSIAPEATGHYGTVVKTDEKIKKLSKEDKAKDVKVLFSGKSGGVFTENINSDHFTKPLDDYKLFISKTADPDNKGSLRRPGRIFIAHPNEACSNSFLKYGSYKDLNQPKNALLYLKTDFATFLFGTLTPTQDAYRKSYALIPEVDFSTGEIIDKPGVFLDFDNPDTLDAQLSEIYELSEFERNLIHKSIKPWKNKLSLTADGLY